jgi:hypothetical protein
VVQQKPAHQKARSPALAMRTIWAIACIVAAVLQAVLPSVFLYLSQEEPYDVFLVVTHHKTGTALAGRLLLTCTQRLGAC